LLFALRRVPVGIIRIVVRRDAVRRIQLLLDLLLLLLLQALQFLQQLLGGLHAFLALLLAGLLLPGLWLSWLRLTWRHLAGNLRGLLGLDFSRFFLDGPLVRDLFL
jgi:hypothetical protein